LARRVLWGGGCHWAALIPDKAITATAHKLAKIIYNMLRDGVEYKEAGQTYYEEQYRGRVLRN